MWMYKSAYKRFKKWEFAGNISSIVFATGGIASSIATSGASLLAVSSVSVLIQAYMKHKKPCKVQALSPSSNSSSIARQNSCD